MDNFTNTNASPSEGTGSKPPHVFLLLKYVHDSHEIMGVFATLKEARIEEAKYPNNALLIEERELNGEWVNTY